MVTSGPRSATRCRASTMSGLKRRFQPTMQRAPLRAAASCSCRVSATRRPGGFSTRVSTPASRHGRAAAKLNSGGALTTTASSDPVASICRGSSYWCGIPNSAATALRVAAAGSHAASSLTPSSPAMCRAWPRPRPPQPTIPTFSSAMTPIAYANRSEVSPPAGAAPAPVRQPSISASDSVICGRRRGSSHSRTTKNPGTTCDSILDSSAAYSTSSSPSRR